MLERELQELLIHEETIAGLLSPEQKLFNTLYDMYNHPNLRCSNMTCPRNFDANIKAKQRSAKELRSAISTKKKQIEIEKLN